MSNMNMELQNYKFQLKNIESQLDDKINLQNLNQVVNMGIQILNIGSQMIYSVMKMHIFDVDYNNLNQQIQNIKMQIQNVEIEINKNMSMKINQINNIQIQMNQMNNLLMLNKNNNIQNNINNKPKISVIFKTTNGLILNMTFDFGITVSQMLKMAFKRMERPDLFKSKNVAIIYNATKLNWDDNTKIEDKFLISQASKYTPTIIINDNNNVIGG